MFGCLLGLRSFDSPKGFLVHKQTSLLITFGGVGLILTSTIAPTTYLESWAFVDSIRTIMLMVDQHPFLLKTLAQVNNNTFPFQQHLKVACYLLPPLLVCFPPFEQLIQ